MFTLKPYNFDVLLENLLNDYDRSLGNVKTSNKLYSRNNSYSLTKEKDNIIFQTIATGLSKEDVVMSIENQKLNVSSKGKEEKFVSNFNYTLYVGDVQPEGAVASLERGILTISIPVKPEHKAFDIKF